MLKLDEVSLLREQCCVNGTWISASSGATFEVRNPATQQVIARVPRMGAEETRAAIAAAAAALPIWSARTASSKNLVWKDTCQMG